MPKLLYASTSPYSSKVRMAAAYAGIAVDLVPIKTEEKPADLMIANPLGKIPVLVLEDGRSIHDSRAITQHLNRVSKSALFPRNPDKRLEAEVLEALADGICDCALSMVYE
ncbi:MAG: glutathione S-transferase, partial [Mesorhizobium sp.]